MKKVILLMVGVGISLSAYAAPKWMEIARNGNGSIFYVDAAYAISQTDGTGWGKVELKKPMLVDGKQATSMVSKIQADCSDRTFQRVDNLFYDKKGVNIGRSFSPGVFNAVPGSIDEKMVDLICRYN